MDYILTHHGIKGQKWGTRNSLPYLLGRATRYTKRTLNFLKTKKKVDSIIHSMDDEDKRKLGMSNSRYLDISYGRILVKRFIKEVDKLPVAFFDVLQDGDNLSLVVGTRGGMEFRGKGYGSETTRRALEWINKHTNMVKGKVYAGVRVDNKASIAIAKKNGFELDPKSYSDDGMWVTYVYRGKQK